MILGLILATINQLPEPEESILDVRSILTPLSYRHFDLPDCAAARTRAGMGSITVSGTSRIPSFVEILLHRIRSCHGTTDLREYEETLEGSLLWSLLRNNTPFYHHYDVNFATDMFEPSRHNKSKLPNPRIMYLSPATLIIVPLNLLGQWDGEVQKHCESSVKCLIVRRSDTLPVARKLASDYDVGYGFCCRPFMSPDD